MSSSRTYIQRPVPSNVGSAAQRVRLQSCQRRVPAPESLIQVASRPFPSTCISGNAPAFAGVHGSILGIERAVGRRGLTAAEPVVSGGTSIGTRSCSSSDTERTRGSASARRTSASSQSALSSAARLMPWWCAMYDSDGNEKAARRRAIRREVGSLVESVVADEPEFFEPTKILHRRVGIDGQRERPRHRARQRVSVAIPRRKPSAGTPNDRYWYV